VVLLGYFVTQLILARALQGLRGRAGCWNSVNQLAEPAAWGPWLVDVISLGVAACRPSVAVLLLTGACSCFVPFLYFCVCVQEVPNVRDDDCIILPRTWLNRGIFPLNIVIAHSSKCSHSATARRLNGLTAQLLFQHPILWLNKQTTKPLRYHGSLSNSRQVSRYPCDATRHKERHTHPTDHPQPLYSYNLWA
jgi:hypothetical protein